MNKVLFIIDSLQPYGAENSIVEIALKLKSIKPVFISLFFKKNSLQSKLLGQDIKLYEMDFSKPILEMNISEVEKIIRYENPDIIHSTLFESDQIARKLINRFPKTLLVGSIISNSYSKRRYKQLSFLGQLKLRYAQIIDKLSAKQVDYFISNSQAIVESNLRALCLDRKKIKVIPRGRQRIDKSITIQKDSRKKNNLFLNVGRLSKNKGHFDIIQAFNLIEPSGEMKLMIAGEGIARHALQKQIDLKKMGEYVKLLGYRNDVPTLLEMADFFLFASYFEGLSGSLIEAIFSKTLCIVSNIPENLECFPPDGALFFEVGDINQMKKACEQAMQLNSEEKLMMVNKSYDYALKKFDLEVVVKKYEDFYNNILKN